MKPTFNDEEPWIAVAKDVIKGDYRKSDNSTLKAVLIGLRNIRHPLTAKAAGMVMNQLKKK